jgi:phenylacetate-CoA ligase
VYTEYGCAEFGPIAFECEAGELHTAAENAHIEVEDNGHSCNNDCRGNLIITELNNYGMPLIRYKIGDMGILTDHQCACGRQLPVLKEISGREVDFIETPEGNIIHGVSFDYLPKYFLEEIKQFQIIKENPGNLLINIVKGNKFNTDTLKRFEEKLRSLIGKSTHVDFRSVEQIPRDKSGKLRFIISKK